jgi:hypothetical protein
MAKDFIEYAHQKADAFHDCCSAPPERERYEVDEGEGDDGMRGSVEAILPLLGDAYLKVYEAVEIIDGSYAHRDVYSYALIVEGQHEHGWERDPINHPEMPVHEHAGDERTRISSDPVTFDEVLDQAWDRLSSREIAPWKDEDEE